MSIVLLVFKIIGIILLVLLAMVLLAVLLVLFCPITYRAKGSYHGKKLQLHGRIFWLGCLLGMFADTDGRDMQIYLRILGIKKSLLKHDNLEDFEDTIANDVQKTGEAAEETAMELTGTKEPCEESKKSDGDHSLPEEEPNKHDENQGMKKKPQLEKKRKRLSLRAISERIKQVFSNLSQALKNFNRTRKRIAQLLQDKRCKMAFRKIWDKVIYLLKKIMPRKLKLALKYCTGSPDTTGELLGILAMFPMGYQNRWSITPDFVSEEFYVESDFDIRGHILGFWLLRVILGIVLDKNCQKLYNKLRARH